MPGHRSTLVLACCALIGAWPCLAQDPTANPAPKTQANTLESMLTRLSDPESQNQTRREINQLKPFPARELIALLPHPQLAIRLGALEILEEKAGRDFDYDPWIQHDDPTNVAAIQRWNQWLEKPEAIKEGNSGLLNDEQRHAYLKDLLSDDFNESARARRMLEIDGLASVAFLEGFLNRTPELDAAKRTRIRAAQYQATLATTFGPQADSMARQLAFGSRDQMLATLGQLKSGGLLSLPIIHDFLNHNDPLVRETAIDAMLASGGAKALPIVKPILLKETDPNVIHGALRRIKEFKGPESLEIVSAFLDAKDEDLLISAIQSSQQLLKDKNPSFGMPGGRSKSTAKEASPTTKNILKALTHESWRVRAAALECVANTNLREAGDTCIKLLEDPDPFVCYQAMNAVKNLRLGEASTTLRNIFMSNPERAGQAIQGYAALGKNIDAEMLEKLDTYSPDAKIAAIQVSTSENQLLALKLHYANDNNLDVSCAALRELVRNEENLQRSNVLSILVDALRSGTPEKTSVLIDNLELPESKNSIDPRLAQQVDSFINTGENTSLDPLYNALLGAANSSPGIKTPTGPIRPNAQQELVAELIKLTQSEDETLRFKAAVILAKARYPQGYQHLIKHLPTYSTAQRSTIASSIYEPTSMEALELLKKLVHDPVDEVRSDAIAAAASADKSPAFIVAILDALNEPGAKLHAADFYSYRLEYATRENNQISKAISAWASNTLANDKAADPTRVLALILLKKRCPTKLQETVIKLAKSSPNPWIRRAAWYTYANFNPRGFVADTATLAKDPSPFVREVLPATTTRIEYKWIYHFDDVHQKEDDSWDSDRERRRISPEQLSALETLASADPSEDVRYHSMLTLLSHGKTIDTTAFSQLLRKRPKEEHADNRISNWMRENVSRLGPGMLPIASALNAEEVNPETMALILSRVSPQQDVKELTSFASLIKQQGGGTTILQPEEKTNTADATERTSIKLVYFFKPGCEECEKTSRILDTMKSEFPLLTIESLNINDTNGTLLNQALCSRFKVPATNQNIAPAVFTQAGHLIRNDINPRAIASLIGATQRLPQDDSWSDFEEPEMTAARENVEQRYQSLTLPVVLIAGLIDGINPCAFATIIFFLSYLQISRRSPRDMLKVGIAFISAVFLAYFSAGLFLHKVLEGMTERISGIKPYLDWIFAGLALLAALLSFNDARKARKGQTADMTLTLPAFLKERIRTVIRTGSKARHFVIAAFVAGVAVSFLELACTGQVYAPIIYSIQQGQMNAIAWLFTYNLAFILPLIAIFALAFTGMSNQKLIQFQLRHTFSVKIALGLVFIALAAVILYGAKWF